MPIVALLAVLYPGAAAQAMAWADRQYAIVSPLPRDEPRLALMDALEAYRQVARKYPSARANRGIGNCLMLIGDYASAALAYGNSALGKEAKWRGRVAKACAKYAHGRAVIQVERVPGESHRWVALFARVRHAEKPQDDDWHFVHMSEASILPLRYEGGAVTSVGAEKRIPIANATGRPLRMATLYLCNGRFGRDPLAMVYEVFDYGDTNSTRQSFYRVTGSELAKVASFEGTSPALVFPSTNARGLHIAVDATWKVFWHDTYEWDGQRFLYANRRFPELYRPDQYTDYADWPEQYSAWMKVAAALTIRGKLPSAVRAWKRAEQKCLLIVRRDEAGASPSYGGRFLGDHRENLKEIRKRLRWIRKGDLNHALLYRPYDFGLQVPPYRLGHAGD